MRKWWFTPVSEVLGLTAASAALRFKRAGRRKHGQRTIWLSIVLYWRKARRGVGQVVAGRPTSRQAMSWSSHVHLHVNTVRHEPPSHRVFSQSVESTTSYVWRRESQTRFLMQRESRQQWREIHRLWRAEPGLADRHNPGPTNIRSVSSPPTRTAPVLKTVTMNYRIARTGWEHRSEGLSRSGGRRIGPTEEGFFGRHPPSRRVWRILGHREITDQIVSAPSNVGREVRRMHAGGSVELVWRQNQQLSSQTQKETVGRTTFPSLGGAVTVGHTQEWTFQERAPAMRAEAARGVALDPGVISQIADDVIRRVEQRARIERERRGL